MDVKGEGEKGKGCEPMPHALSCGLTMQADGTGPLWQLEWGWKSCKALTSLVFV